MFLFLMLKKKAPSALILCPYGRAPTVIGDSSDFEGTEHEYVQDYFSGLAKTLFTLLQVQSGSVNKGDPF